MAAPITGFRTWPARRVWVVFQARAKVAIDLLPGVAVGAVGVGHGHRGGLAGNEANQPERRLFHGAFGPPGVGDLFDAIP